MTSTTPGTTRSTNRVSGASTAPAGSTPSAPKSFQIIGGFPSIRKGFEQRGWVADD
ncbi:unnamed protein product, partial [Amoebophrya sp. A25]|eukprot:GSA25T00019106001.1